jgi:membrane-bound serine protease (ClpP class)
MMKDTSTMMRTPHWPVRLAALLLIALAWTPASRSQEETQGVAEGVAVDAVDPSEETTAIREIFLAKIDDDIDLVESAYIKRLTEQAREAKAGALVLELNTFGGRVDAAVAIRDALIDVSASGVTTYVFINKRAISAGALISLACDKIIMSPGGTIGAATPIQTAPGQEMPEAVEEKYLSYFREEMRSTAESKGRDPEIAEAMVDSAKVVDEVSKEGKLLTLSTSKAMELGFVDFEAATLEEALVAVGLAKASRQTVERSWSEGLVGFLTSSTISSFLFLCMIIFAYMEYQTPGFGIFGGGAIFCFLVLFFSHYLVNLAGWEELILFSVGLALLLLELLVIPGFGVAGITGLLCMLTSAVLLFQAGDWGDLSISNPFTLDAIQRVLLSTVLGFVVLLLFMHYLPNGRRPGSLILSTALGRAAGYTSLEEDRVAGAGEAADPLEGATGTALTTLRPTGRAQLGKERYEVETEGEFIDKGTAVRFLRRRSGRIIVRGEG